jgi:hypothetical protein
VANRHNPSLPPLVHSSIPRVNEALVRSRAAQHLYFGLATELDALVEMGLGQAQQMVLLVDKQMAAVHQEIEWLSQLILVQ